MFTFSLHRLNLRSFHILSDSICTHAIVVAHLLEIRTASIHSSIFRNPKEKLIKFIFWSNFNFDVEDVFQVGIDDRVKEDLIPMTFYSSFQDLKIYLLAAIVVVVDSAYFHHL